MKRIFSIFLCAVVVAALFVPLSTYAAEDDSIVGTWILKDDINYPNTSILVKSIDASFYGRTSYYSETFDFVSMGYFYVNDNSIQFSSSSWGGSTATRTEFYSYKDAVTYYVSSGSRTVEHTLSTVGVNMKLVTFHSDVTDPILKEWIKQNMEPYSPYCDGTCAVPDENLDGICEDCGMPFSLRNIGYEYNHSVTFNTANGVIRAEYMSNEPFTIRGYKYGTSYRVEPSIDVYCMTYLNDELTYQGLVAMHYPSNNLDDTVVSSTFDWYTSSSSGEIFFPLPLWVMVEKVTQGEMIPFSNQTVGNLMTLALCGVGLITLLVGLYLLLKTFKPYRH